MGGMCAAAAVMPAHRCNYWRLRSERIASAHPLETIKVKQERTESWFSRESAFIYTPLISLMWFLLCKTV